MVQQAWLTAYEAGKLAGISDRAIHRYLRDFPEFIEHDKIGNKSYINPACIDVIKKIYTMRDDKLGTEGVKILLEQEGFAKYVNLTSELRVEEEQDELQIQAVTFLKRSFNDHREMLAVIGDMKELLTSAIEHHEQTAVQIGELKAENQELKEKLAEMNEAMAAIVEAQKQVAATVEAQTAGVDTRLNDLVQAFNKNVEELHKKPWWRFW